MILNKRNRKLILLLAILCVPLLLQAQIQDDSKLTFTPGDALFINMFPDTNSFLNGTYPIDANGLVEFPMLGKVNVRNMKVGDLKFFLMNEFKEYLRYPNMYIKPMARVSLLGGFVRPGLYYVDINSSLWETVNLAGGLVLEDGIYDMRWERDHKAQAKDLTSMFERGMSLRNMGFKSGDQIWTPSPNRRTWIDTARDVLPFMTFATSIWLMYNTYQRDQLLFNR